MDSYREEAGSNVLQSYKSLNSSHRNVERNARLSKFSLLHKIFTLYVDGEQVRGTAAQGNRSKMVAPCLQRWATVGLCIQWFGEMAILCFQIAEPSKVKP